MKDVSIIGVDLAKRVSQMHGATAEGEVVFRMKLSRKQFFAFMQTHLGFRVAMEACATAHHWARTLMALGRDVRLIAPKFVKPYVDNQKMGWLPPSPDGIVMCQGRGVQRHEKERTANKGYNDRCGPGKERLPASQR